MLKPDLEKNAPAVLMGRRAFLAMSASALAGLVLWGFRKPERVEAGAGPSKQPKIVRIVEFSDAGAREGIVDVPKIVKSDEEWRKQLSRAAFEVTRKEGTEMAFSGAYWNLHEKGMFRCVCCGTAVFSSATKFDSGTGWPSFWAPIAKENVQEAVDMSLGMMRTAVSCRRCDGHLGHVFNDGPRPTGLRYCINSVALQFVKAA